MEAAGAWDERQAWEAAEAGGLGIGIRTRARDGVTGPGQRQHS